ncbi:sensor histidine kinase [Luteimonas abyssi]|uniref:sensor histidine kinase n=1 Tax=Luteimonas abyssi TaxID=1247514 RepID=UPI000A5CC8F7|nr:sensor histidine kinase [Luteimonas abyssi]
MTDSSNDNLSNFHQLLDRPLPRWASVAITSRIAKRFADAYVNDVHEPAGSRIAVRNAVALAEQAALRGGDGDVSDAFEIDGEYFDNYDIQALAMALGGYAQAASKTHTDLSLDEHSEPSFRRGWSAIALTLIALRCAFPDIVSEAGAQTMREAVDWSVKAESATEHSIFAELTRAHELARHNSWSDKSPVVPADLGALWPNGRPDGWPSPRLTFRPRARIIRTIGDRLISGPEAAVIELVKNSYDADARSVRITLIPPLKAGAGEIVFSDDGHGMAFSDIRDKWMEPATSDKRTRSTSPGGRKLLGSKGIGRFAAARLGSHLRLISVASNSEGANQREFERTTISDLDWEQFEEAKYLDTVSFAYRNELTDEPPGTRLYITHLRDEWTEASINKLHDELRRLVSPVNAEDGQFEIHLDLSNCTVQNCGFDGFTILGVQPDLIDGVRIDPWKVRPFPVLDASDYVVDGIFDESGIFEGTMTIQRAGGDPIPISLRVPLGEGQEPCGIVVVRLSIFDREAETIRSTAQKAGFGHLGIREARKLLDKIAGIAIYRAGFRVRPYGDAENDWLTLDAKRVQNPTLKIGRNQVAGTVIVDDEESSSLVERSSREGLEENGSFRRLQSLLLTLLSEEIEPRRRKFRISAGIDRRPQANIREVIDTAQHAWADALLSKMPSPERQEAEKVIARETDRLSDHVKELEERQAKLEAQVTLGLIVGEVMHQGNTPLTFIENESARLRRQLPTLFDDSKESQEDRDDLPKIYNGLNANAASLRTLFNALSPLSGANRGKPQDFPISRVVSNIKLFFRSRMDTMGLIFEVDPEVEACIAHGYEADLTTALTNLVDNSLHWLGHRQVAAPRIVLSPAPSVTGKLAFVFEDNGPGVSPEFEDQLFDVGFSTRTNGTGLGLSIAREAMFRSNGDLTLVPADKGAKFQLIIARADR